MARPRSSSSSPLTFLAGTFGRGLLVLVPTVGTLYSVWVVLRWVDGAIGVPVPGLGLLITLSLIFVTGFVASNVVGQALVGTLEGGLKRLPVVSIIFSSIKDLLGAFVGEKKSFDRPAMVTLDAEGKVRVFGFVTCSRFDDARLAGHVAVYLPQAYNFAGNVIIVPESRVETVDADPAQFMAFVVSGGVSEMSGARTQYEERSRESLLGLKK